MAKDKEVDQGEAKEIVVGESVEETAFKGWPGCVSCTGYAPVGGPLKASASRQNPTCNVVLNVRDEDVPRKWPFKGPQGVFLTRVPFKKNRRFCLEHCEWYLKDLNVFNSLIQFLLKRILLVIRS